MFRKKDAPAQQTLWIPTTEIVSTPANTFYERLDQLLETNDFPRQVRELCRPFYAERQEGGRPGIDPVVYFKMLFIRHSAPTPKLDQFQMFAFVEHLFPA